MSLIIVPGTDFNMDLLSTATTPDTPVDFTTTAATFIFDGGSTRLVILKWRPAGGSSAGVTADSAGVYIRKDGTWTATTFPVSRLLTLRIEKGLPPDQQEVGTVGVSIELPGPGPIPVTP